MSRKRPHLRNFRRAAVSYAAEQPSAAVFVAPARAPAALNMDAELALLKHQLERAHAEIQRLHALAYVDPAAAPGLYGMGDFEGDEPATWKDKAESLALQLNQLQPGACKQLEVTLLEDHHDCETCGSAFAQGALVRLNGEVVVDRTPCAHCFGSKSYPLDQVLCEALERLGYEVKVVPSTPPQGEDEDGG